MQSKQSSIIAEEPEVNVPSSRHHIGVSICSHKVGTSVVNKAIYHKGEIQIFQDTENFYHHKGIEFQIKDGWFLSDHLNLELPRKTNLTAFERVILALGMPLTKDDSAKGVDASNIPFRELLQVLTMMALKDHSIISNAFSYRKQRSYGVNVFEVYYRVISGSGRIKAKQKNIRWLNEEDTYLLKAKLFNASSYQPGTHSMKYEPIELAEKIMSTVFELFKLLEFKKKVVECQVLDFIITMNNLSAVRLRDVMLLLSDCISYDDGFVIRPRLEDRQYSRIYSVFTSISSETRKVLGFTNYDIGAALQTICLQRVDEPSLYPVHQELMNDKIAFRAKVQRETGKDYKWVKKELSKINNEKDTMPKRYEKSQTLKAYYREAMLLRKEIISSAEPLMRSRAEEFAKPKWEKSSWNRTKNEYDWITYEKKESSIFFFIWTQWERQIREAMMSCFNEPSACHQVHDAVYSKQIIDPRDIEEKVFMDTGFKVQISTD